MKNYIILKAPMILTAINNSVTSFQIALAAIVFICFAFYVHKPADER